MQTLATKMNDMPIQMVGMTFPEGRCNTSGDKLLGY